MFVSLCGPTTKKYPYQEIVLPMLETHNQILLENQEPKIFLMHEKHISTTNLGTIQLIIKPHIFMINSHSQPTLTYTNIICFSLLASTMSKTNVRRHALEKCRSVKETQKILNHSFFTRNLKKVYPIGLQKSTSSLSLSSISLSLSQNSNDSSQADSLTPLDEKISLALRLISPRERREPTIAASNKPLQQQHQQPPHTTEPGELKRCNWITKSCGMINFIFNTFIFQFCKFIRVSFVMNV